MYTLYIYIIHIILIIIITIIYMVTLQKIEEWNPTFHTLLRILGNTQHVSRFAVDILRVWRFEPSGTLQQSNPASEKPNFSRETIGKSSLASFLSNNPWHGSASKYRKICGEYGGNVAKINFSINNFSHPIFF